MAAIRVAGVWLGKPPPWPASVIKSLKEGIRATRAHVTPSRPTAEIGHDYLVAFQDGSVSDSRGASYEWIRQRFSRVPALTGTWLPSHARIGGGVHAGQVVSQEQGLLTDAAYFLTRTNHLCDAMTTLANLGAPSTPRQLDAAGALVANACANAKASFSATFAFLECLVNGIGHELAARPELTAENREVLLGVGKNRFLELASKMDSFCEISNSGGKAKFRGLAGDALGRVTSEARELRNSLVHHSPSKKTIWLGAFEWQKLSSVAFEDAMKVSIAFWMACFPHQRLPDHLGEFDKARLVQGARDRFLVEYEFPMTKQQAVTIHRDLPDAATRNASASRKKTKRAGG